MKDEKQTLKFVSLLSHHTLIPSFYCHWSVSISDTHTKGENMKPPLNVHIRPASYQRCHWCQSDLMILGTNLTVNQEKPGPCCQPVALSEGKAAIKVQKCPQRDTQTPSRRQRAALKQTVYSLTLSGPSRVISPLSLSAQTQELWAHFLTPPWPTPRRLFNLGTIIPSSAWPGQLRPETSAFTQLSNSKGKSHLLIKGNLKDSGLKYQRQMLRAGINGVSCLTH